MPPATELVVDVDREEWTARLHVFCCGKPRDDFGHDNSKPVGTWRPKWGPKPTEPGCFAPPELLAIYSAKYSRSPPAPSSSEHAELKHPASQKYDPKESSK
jgi:hypothetical protein